MIKSKKKEEKINKARGNRILVPKVGFLIIGTPAPFSGYVFPMKGMFEKLKEKAIGKLEDAGLKVIQLDRYVTTPEEAIDAVREMDQKNVDIIVYFSASWVDSSVIYAAVLEKDFPFVIWGVSADGGGESTFSYIGSQANVTSLREIGKRFKYILNFSEESVREITIYAKAAAIVKKLRKSRVGMIGYITRAHHYDVMIDPIGVQRVLGPKVVSIDTMRLMNEIANITDIETRQFIRKLRKKFKKVEGTEQVMLKTAKLSLALYHLKKEFRLDAIAIKCQPELSEYYGASACLPASMMIDEGIPVSCEADVNSAILMLIMYYFTGKASFHTDVWAFDEKTQTLLCSHCGVGAFSLAADKSEVKICSHEGDHVMEEKGKFGGLFPNFWIKPGKVTLAALTGREKSFRMQVSNGTIVDSEKETGEGVRRLKHAYWARRWPRALVRISDLKDFHDKMVAHHYVIIHGDLEQELKEVSDLLNVKFNIDYGTH